MRQVWRTIDVNVRAGDGVELRVKFPLARQELLAQTLGAGNIHAHALKPHLDQKWNQAAFHVEYTQKAIFF